MPRSRSRRLTPPSWAAAPTPPASNFWVGEFNRQRSNRRAGWQYRRRDGARRFFPSHWGHRKRRRGARQSRDHRSTHAV